MKAAFGEGAREYMRRQMQVRRAHLCRTEFDFAGMSGSGQAWLPSTGRVMQLLEIVSL
jgi:hypothetical protein